MNLHEYQAKQLFREYKISVSEGLAASSSDEAEKVAKSLNVDKNRHLKTICAFFYCLLSV